MPEYAQSIPRRFLLPRLNPRFLPRAIASETRERRENEFLIEGRGGRLNYFACLVCFVGRNIAEFTAGEIWSCVNTLLRRRHR